MNKELQNNIRYFSDLLQKGKIEDEMYMRDVGAILSALFRFNKYLKNKDLYLISERTLQRGIWPSPDEMDQILNGLNITNLKGE